MNNKILRTPKKVKIKAVAKLTWKTFIGQPVGIIITFGAPLILFIIIPYLLKGMMHQDIGFVLWDITPGLLLIPTIIIGMLGIPITLSAMKETGLLKKMNVVGIKSLTFITSFILVFMVIILLGTLALFAIGSIIWQSDMPMPSGASFLIPWLLTMIASISIGLLIGAAANSQGVAFAIGIALFLPVVFLSGIIFVQMDDVLAKIAKVIPINHLVGLFRSSWHLDTLVLTDYTLPFSIPSELLGPEALKHLSPTTIADLKANGQFLENGSRVIDLTVINNEFWDSFLAYGYPIVITSVVIGGVAKKFKWE